MSQFCKFAPHLRELRLHLCQTGKASSGARDFINQNYTKIKAANPTIPILIRECSGVQPKLWVRLAGGHEKCSSLANLSAGDIAGVLTKLTSKAS